MEKDNKNNINEKTGNNVSNDNFNNEYVSIDIKNIFRVLRKRIWWFIIAFAVIFCAVFSFTYFVTPESKYSVHSTMMVATDNIRYQEKVNYYFPKIAYDLLFIANEEYPLNSLNYYYMDTADYLTSDKVIDKAYQESGGVFDKETLKKSITAEKSLDGTQLDVSVSYKDKNDTKKIAQAIRDSFIESRAADFEASYNELSGKITGKIDKLNNEISILQKQADDYSIEFNKKIIEELKGISGNNISFVVSGYMPPDIKVKMDADNSQLADLKEIKSNLEEYKNMYINRIVLNSSNEVIANISILKNTIISLAAGVIFGLLFAFAANYFKSE